MTAPALSPTNATASSASVRPSSAFRVGTRAAQLAKTNPVSRNATVVPLRARRSRRGCSVALTSRAGGPEESGTSEDGMQSSLRDLLYQRKAYLDMLF